MRRLGLAALLLAAGLALAGGLSSAVRAEDAPPPTTTTETTTPEPAAPPPAAQVLPENVTIQGVTVGGLTPTAAYLALSTSFREPLHVLVGKTRLAPTRESLGATAYLWGAIGRALSAAPGSDVKVVVAVKGAAVRAYVKRIAERYDRKPVGAKLRLRHLKPFVTKERPGQRLLRVKAVAAIVAALKANDDETVTLPVAKVAPKVTRKGFGPVIVIRRGQNVLRLYNGMHLRKAFRVATGQRIYPTPLGRFEIVTKWRNPWWYPPDSDWAKGEKPVPPGPGNPLGTRWMGISSPGVGIHGTPDAASLGYSASHGCIRMAIPQAEWLFEHVEIGTPVYIVAA